MSPSPIDHLECNNTILDLKKVNKKLLEEFKQLRKSYYLLLFARAKLHKALHNLIDYVEDTVKEWCEFCKEEDKK